MGVQWEWEDELATRERNERAYQQAIHAAREAEFGRTIPYAYGEKLARMYYPHLFTQ